MLYSTEVNGCLVYQLDRHCDERGYFQEIYNNVFSFLVKQANISVSKKNVLRGIHVNNFAKLVHCVKGKIYDVVVDVRRYSPTKLKWHGQLLTEESSLCVYVPPGCGHAFLALEDSVVCYMQEGIYNPQEGYSIHYSDKALKICWPGSDFILSEKDAEAGFFNE